MLTKKRELFASDKEEMQRKWQELEKDKAKFEEQHKVIRATAEKLAVEREKISFERAKYEAEREKLVSQQKDLGVQKSVLQSDFLRAEQMEHELNQRENNLNMFEFSQQLRQKNF